MISLLSKAQVILGKRELSRQLTSVLRLCTYRGTLVQLVLILIATRNRDELCRLSSLYTILSNIFSRIGRKTGVAWPPQRPTRVTPVPSIPPSSFVLTAPSPPARPH